MVAASFVTLSACTYSFTGGGLPGHIRTVAIGQWENATAQPLLTSDLQLVLQTELPRGLGVRIADESVADAVIRGRITGYDEPPASVRAGSSPGAPNQQVQVLQRDVRITFDAEIYDRRRDQVLWQSSGQSATGQYNPDRQTSGEGRTRAIRVIVEKLVEGAQSQW